MRSQRILATLLALLVANVALASPASADASDGQQNIVVDDSKVTIDLSESSSSGGGKVKPVTLNSDCTFGGQTVDWLVNWKNSERPEQFLIGYDEELLDEPAGTDIGYMWCVDIGWGRAWLATARQNGRFDAWFLRRTPS